MNTFRRLAKPVAYFVVVGFVALSIHAPAHAALVATDGVVNSQQAEQDRSRLQDMLSRDDVKQRLLAHGVDPQQALERVAALSDEEARTLSQKMDDVPAGGDALGVVLVVFLVLLVTDILGYTDIFPFVKKPVRR